MVIATETGNTVFECMQEQEYDVDEPEDPENEAESEISDAN